MGLRATRRRPAGIFWKGVARLLGCNSARFSLLLGHSQRRGICGVAERGMIGLSWMVVKVQITSRVLAHRLVRGADGRSMVHGDGLSGD
jgi:hypothetical protein